MRVSNTLRRLSRRTLMAFVTASLLAVSVLGGSASAATPNWDMEPVVLLPSSVTPGEAAGYKVTIRNDGPSNIAQLFLVAYLGDTDSPAPTPVYTKVAPKGSCPNTGGSLYCTLGSLKAGKSVTVTVAFTTPTEGATFSIRFVANTTGATSSDGGTSHGDTIDETGTTTLTSDPDFAGRFVLGNNLTVANGLALGADNHQSTTVYAPASIIPVTVADGDQVTPVVCPAELGCWSQTSEIHVNDGVPAGIFKVEIGIYKDLSQSVDGVYHEFDAGHVPASETITTKCPKHGKPSSPCFTAENIGGGSILVTVWLLENGKISNY